MDFLLDLAARLFLFGIFYHCFFALFFQNLIRTSLLLIINFRCYNCFMIALVFPNKMKYLCTNPIHFYQQNVFYFHILRILTFLRLKVFDFTIQIANHF